MRVNSAFSGLFTCRFIARSGVAIMLFCISGMYASARSTETEASLGRTPHERDWRAKELNLIIREIGHRLLLQAGDSTSRVLPVIEDQGTFVLRFENEFVFSHDSLMALSQNLLPKTEFPSGYTVTVHDRLSANIVYGFQFNNTRPDILGCKGRSEPSGCYVIEFTFPDFQAIGEPEKTDIDASVAEISSIKTDGHNDSVKQLRKENKSKVISEDTNLRPEGIRLKTVTKDIDHIREELKSVQLDIQESNSNHKEVKAKTPALDFPLMNVVYGGVLVLLSVALFIVRFGKLLKPASIQSEEQIILKQYDEEFLTLGKFSFDLKGQRLLLGNQVTSLTDKECKILELLNEGFGVLILRETLMQKVWIDEGVITGRSLDMFVSKLRKKLSGDPELRITNIHGKGYKLETVSA